MGILAYRKYLQDQLSPQRQQSINTEEPLRRLIRPTPPEMREDVGDHHRRYLRDLRRKADIIDQRSPHRGNEAMDLRRKANHLEANWFPHTALYAEEPPVPFYSPQPDPGDDLGEPANTINNTLLPPEEPAGSIRREGERLREEFTAQKAARRWERPELPEEPANTINNTLPPPRPLPRRQERPLPESLDTQTRVLIEGGRMERGKRSEKVQDILQRGRARLRREYLEKTQELERSYY